VRVKKVTKRLLRKRENKERKKAKTSHSTANEIRKEIALLHSQLRKARAGLVDLGPFPVKGDLRDRLEYMEKVLPPLRRWRHLDDRLNRLKEKLKKIP